MPHDHQPTTLRSLGVGALIGGGVTVLVWALAGCGPAVRYSAIPSDPPPMPQSSPVIQAVESQRVALADAPAMALTIRTQAAVVVAASEVIQKRGKLSLAWTASPDASAVGYRLYFGTNSGMSFSWLSATVGNTKNATITGLDEGTRYYVVCVAYDALGVESVNSNEASGVTPIYVSLTTQCWNVGAYGMPGRTNQIQMSTNLTAWFPILTWVGNGVATNVMHTNTTMASFRVEALP